MYSLLSFSFSVLCIPDFNILFSSGIIIGILNPIGLKNNAFHLLLLLCEIEFMHTFFFSKLDVSGKNFSLIVL